MFTCSMPQFFVGAFYWGNPVMTDNSRYRQKLLLSLDGYQLKPEQNSACLIFKFGQCPGMTYSA